MKAKQLKELLVSAIKNKKPVLIKGAPGVGKSDIVAQAATEAKADIILTHPVVSDPTDFKGLPGIVNGKAEFMPFGDLRQLMEAKKETVCFLDDLGQAPPVVQAACMQLLLARKINGVAISDKITFIAATNRREDKAGVTSILEPVKSRFDCIVELEVSVDDWTEWAIENDINEKMIAFVRFRPDLLTNPGEPTNDIVNRPCPRTITKASEWLDLGIDDYEVLEGALGKGAAIELLGFIKIYEELPSLDEILLNPKKSPYS